MDTKEKVLTIAGSIVTLGIGYLVWRHERSITLQDNKQQQAAIAAEQQSNDQSLLNALSTQYYPSGGASSSQSYDTGSSSSITPSSGSADLQAILEAFFGTRSSGSSSGPGSTGAASGGDGVNVPLHAVGPEPVTGTPIDGGAGPAVPVNPTGPANSVQPIYAGTYNIDTGTPGTTGIASGGGTVAPVTFHGGPVQPIVGMPSQYRTTQSIYAQMGLQN